MQNNLTFTGIHESVEENCEDKVKCFIRDKLQLTQDIQFDRVHRLGRRPLNRDLSRKPRKIVVRFTKFKDREMARVAAPKTLKVCTSSTLAKLKRGVENFIHD